MSRTLIILSLAGGAALLALAVSRRSATPGAPDLSPVFEPPLYLIDPARDLEINIPGFAPVGGGFPVLVDPGPWKPPQRAEPYLGDIANAEQSSGVPTGLLARLLYQESRFRKDIISGKTESSAGAQGIAQIVPRWHPNVDPLNPTAAIFYAAGYLRSNFERFGDWALALAAYNMGPNALERRGPDPRNWPSETVAYVSDITSDVPV